MKPQKAKNGKPNHHGLLNTFIDTKKVKLIKHFKALKQTLNLDANVLQKYKNLKQKSMK